MNRTRSTRIHYARVLRILPNRRRLLLGRCFDRDLSIDVSCDINGLDSIGREHARDLGAAPKSRDGEDDGTSSFVTLF